MQKWTILPFRTTLAAWLDGADPAGTGIVPANGPLNSWVDKSGNGRDSSAVGTAGTYSNGGVTIISPSTYQISFTTVTTETRFVVFSTTSPGTATKILSGGSSDDGTFIYFTGGAIYDSNYTSGTSIRGTNVLTSNITLVDMTTTATSNSLYINGILNGLSNGKTFTNSTITVGGSGVGGSGTLTIYEVLIYSSALTTSQRQAVESYLLNKWSITTPVPKTAGLALWLDATDPAGTGIIPASGTITTWTDKAGLYSVTGTGVFSYGSVSLPRFTSTYTPSTETAFLVFSVINSSNVRIPLLSGSGNTRSFTITSSMTLSLDKGTPLLSDTTTLASNTLILAVYTQSTAGMNIFINGTATSSTATNPSFTPSATTIGSNSTATFSGRINEIIIYSNVLPTIQRQQVETYLATKWNITLSYSNALLSNTTYQPTVNVGYQTVPSGNPGTSTLYYDGRNWSLN